MLRTHHLCTLPKVGYVMPTVVYIHLFIFVVLLGNLIKFMWTNEIWVNNEKESFILIKQTNALERSNQSELQKFVRFSVSRLSVNLCT